MAWRFSHASGVLGVAFSPDGRLLASAGDDRTVLLWHVGSGRRGRVLSGHKARVRGVAFSPDGRLLASGGDDHEVRLWEVHRGDLVRPLPAHRGRVWAVAFSPDGSLLASVGDDGTVRLWQQPFGSGHVTLSGHHGMTWSVTFSPDGRLLATGGEDGTVRLWDVRAGAELAVLLPTAGGWAVLLPDGGYKFAGDVGSDFWWAVKLSRFKPGVLDRYVPSIRRLADEEPIPPPDTDHTLIR